MINPKAYNKGLIFSGSLSANIVEEIYAPNVWDDEFKKPKIPSLNISFDGCACRIIEIAIDSPIALEKASIIPTIIPGLAALKIILYIALDFVFPNANGFCIKLTSTLFNESNVIVTMVGIIIKHNIIDPLNMEFGFMLNKDNHTLPNDSKANNPNITEGIPLKTWKIIIIVFLYFLFNRYLINNADLILKGTAITIANKDVNKVIEKGIQKEYWFVVVEKSPWNKMFTNPYSLKPLIAYIKMKTIKVINKEIIDNAKLNEIHFAILLI